MTTPSHQRRCGDGDACHVYACWFSKAALVHLLHGHVNYAWDDNCRSAGIDIYSTASGKFANSTCQHHETKRDQGTRHYAHRTMYGQPVTQASFCMFEHVLSVMDVLCTFYNSAQDTMCKEGSMTAFICLDLLVTLITLIPTTLELGRNPALQASEHHPGVYLLQGPHLESCAV